MVLSISLDGSKFPLTLIPLLFADCKCSYSITVAVIEIPLIYPSILEIISALTEFAAVHELSLKAFSVLCVRLLSVSVDQVLRPGTFIDVAILSVLVLALTFGV